MVFFLVIILAFVLAANFDLILYGLRQGKGQLEIIWNARPNDEWLNDPAFPDSLKRKIKFVEEVKKFAFDTLGIRHTENYSTMYDQQGKPLMFVVTACPPFELKAIEFKFPLLGTFTYKGFFDKELALDLEEELKGEGYDADVRVAGGWSTLGWFKDPILSEMLNRGEGHLAETIIHELTHGTLFVKDSLRFNENLATFIGSYGARLFLSNKFGMESREYREYMNYWADRRIYLHHMLKGAGKLDSLYGSFTENLSFEEKITLKNNLIGTIVTSVDTLGLYNLEKYRKLLMTKEINNTFFMSYMRYHGDFELLDKELHEKYEGDIKAMLADYESRFPTL